jgi:hypothetical protein
MPRNEICGRPAKSAILSCRKRNEDEEWAKTLEYEKRTNI